MKISDLGERALIERISRLLARPRGNVVVGAGEDDCAVLDIGGQDYFLVTTDMLHRKTDFHPQMTGRQIGWMSVAVNLSDLASKGARPIGILIAMGIPPDTELGFIDDAVKGMDDCASKYGAQIIGGDIDSHDELTITGTAFGTTKKDMLIRRSGARIGDLVCLTGVPGKAGAALQALNRKLPVGEELLKALFEPLPRIKEGMALAESRAVTSMMDMSDGLALSLYDMNRANGTGFKIYESSLPVLPEINGLKNEELKDATVFWGGDFELLFTIDPSKIETAKRACSLTIIGEVIKKGIYIERAGNVEELIPEGYEHWKP
jgi:thiamine-monophosphate kinase